MGRAPEIESPFQRPYKPQRILAGLWAARSSSTPGISLPAHQTCPSSSCSSSSASWFMALMAAKSERRSFQDSPGMAQERLEPPRELCVGFRGLGVGV